MLLLVVVLPASPLISADLSQAPAGISNACEKAVFEYNKPQQSFSQANDSGASCRANRRGERSKRKLKRLDIIYNQSELLKGSKRIITG